MRRADRLFRIVQMLRGGRLTTAARLAEEMEVTTRTIYRDIADLVGSGVPIQGEAGVGYLMDEGYDLPPLMFDSDEIVALVAGARLIRAWGGARMASAAEEALVKIEAVLPDAARRQAGAVSIHAVMTPDLDEGTRRLLDRLEDAAERRERLSFTYLSLQGEQSTRTVRPLGLWFWGKVWTLVSWCELREGFRMFRVDRMSGIEGQGRFPDEPGKRLRDFYEQERHRPRP